MSSRTCLAFQRMSIRSQCSELIAQLAIHETRRTRVAEPFPPLSSPKSNPTNWFAYAGNDTGAQNCFYLTNNCAISRYDPLRGDPFFELDTKLAKNIKTGERLNVQIIAQAFNLNNRANYGNNFGNNISSAGTFGHPIGFFAPNATFIPRSIWSEFGVHLRF